MCEGDGRDLQIHRSDTNASPDESPGRTPRGLTPSNGMMGMRRNVSTCACRRPYVASNLSFVFAWAIRAIHPRICSS